MSLVHMYLIKLAFEIISTAKKQRNQNGSWDIYIDKMFVKNLKYTH